MSRVIPNIVFTSSVSSIKDIFAPIKAKITELKTSGATNLKSKSCFLRFRKLVVMVLTEFTKSPLTLAMSNDKPTILRVGTKATAEPSPAIAKIVERSVVTIK